MKFTSEIGVKLLDTNFADERVCNADPAATAGLINSLMRNRHGSPFEHMNATWQVKAPLFVWREHHRHRIASYNEESARYKVLEPEFYVPGPDRPLVQVGKAMAYELQPGSPDLYVDVRDAIETASASAYTAYTRLLDAGVARERPRRPLKGPTLSDQINPSHYRGFSNGAQVIDIAERLNFNRGNAIKYIARAGRKQDADTITDLEKAKWYLEREIERIKTDGMEVMPQGTGRLINPEVVS